MGMRTLSAATSAFTVSMLSAGGQSMRMTSKSVRRGSSACRSLVSRPIGSVSSRTSATVRSWLAGSSWKPPRSTPTRASLKDTSPSRTSQALRVSCDLSTPLPMVALPCGSRSMSRTRRLVAAREAARLTAVVVLPTPPFWFAMAMTRFMGDSVLHCHARKGADFTGARAFSGDQLVSESEALARHLVGHRVGGAVLAPCALEDLGEAPRNRLDVADHLGLARAAVISERDD